MTDTFKIPFDEIAIRKDSVAPDVFAAISAVARCDGDDSEIYLSGDLIFCADGLGGTMFYGIEIAGGELHGEAYCTAHHAAEIQCADDISDNISEGEDDCPDEAEFYWNAARGSIPTFGRGR